MLFSLLMSQTGFSLSLTPVYHHASSRLLCQTVTLVCVNAIWDFDTEKLILWGEITAWILLILLRFWLFLFEYIPFLLPPPSVILFVCAHWSWIVDVEDGAAVWWSISSVTQKGSKGDWNPRGKSYSYSCRGTINATYKNKTMCDVGSCHLFVSGLPVCRAYGVLIEVTQGSRAAGLDSENTHDCTVRLQWLLVPEKALNISFSGFTQGGCI